jgi:ribosome biogenesis protein Nip4
LWPIDDFAGRFNTNIRLDRDLIVKKSNRYFLLNRNLKGLIVENFFYAGLYLGKTNGKTFFPSFCLLAMIAQSDANKTTVDSRTEWLFTCGRDIFRKGITSMSKSRKKGDYTLILNAYGDCLGFGRILRSMDDAGRNQVVVKNIADIGDFLRREK